MAEVSLTGISKTYGSTKAVDNITMDIPMGPLWCCLDRRVRVKPPLRLISGLESQTLATSILVVIR